MVLMLLAIDATGHLFAWTATRRKDGWLFLWVSLGLLRRYWPLPLSFQDSTVALLPATFAVAVEFLYRHGFELAMAYLRYYRGLSVFLRKPQFHLCARRGDQRCSRDT